MYSAAQYGFRKIDNSLNGTNGKRKTPTVNDDEIEEDRFTEQKSKENEAMNKNESEKRQRQESPSTTDDLGMC